MERNHPVLLFVVVLISLLLACSSSDINNGSETKAIFTGTIEIIEGQNAIVSIEKGEILKSGR